jgi:hypothetical protein
MVPVMATRQDKIENDLKNILFMGESASQLGTVVLVPEGIGRGCSF